MKSLAGFILVLITCLAPHVIYAQHKINFKHYNINHGLSQNTVFCLLEDRQCLIWIGTEDGLNKFDGYTFTVYKHKNSDPQSISHNQINALYEDKSGNIWVATSSGLNIFDKKKESFELLPIPNDLSDFITSIFEDSKGNIWITSLNGLLLYHPTQKKFSHFGYKNNTRADKIFEAPDGIFWLSLDKDLRRFDPVKKQFLALPPTLENDKRIRNSYPRTIKQDDLKRIWIGTETAGLFIYDSKSNTLEHLENDKSNKNSLPINTIRDLYFNHKNEVWIATRSGLSIFNTQRKRFQNYQNDIYDSSSISQNSVRSILKDLTEITEESDVFPSVST